jgi:HK97 gp10 family phage protein
VARATFIFPREIISKIMQLGNKTDEIIEKSLEAGAGVVEDKVRYNLAGIIGKDTKTDSRSTGELSSSLGTSSPLVDKNGNYNLKIGFAEPRKEQNTARGKRSYKERTNAMIASVLEYGKHGQAPKPFLKPAISSSKKEATAAMVTKFEEEVAKL